MKRFTKRYLLYKTFYYLNKINVSSYFNRVKLRTGDVKFIIPIRKGIGLSHILDSEKWMYHILKVILPTMRESYFIDVGVNVGQTLIRAKSISEDLMYIGFEPNVRCVNYVNELIEINFIKNTVLIPTGLSNKTQLMELFFFSDSADDASASMINGFRSNEIRKEAVVALHPNDIDLLSRVKIGCIKIDVEGGELEVIEGLSDLIQRNKPAIICEILPCYDEAKSSRVERQDNLQNFLKAMDYEVYRININSYELSQMDNIGIHSNLDESNYIFLHCESPLKILLLKELCSKNSI